MSLCMPCDVSRQPSSRSTCVVDLRDDEAAAQAPATSHRRLFLIAAAVVLLSVLLAVPGVRASAAQFLSLFRVVNFVAVQVQPSRLDSLKAQDLEIGKLIGEHVQVLADPGPPFAVGSLDEAAKVAGMSIAVPQWLPADTRIIETMAQGERVVRITASATRLQQVMDALGISDLTAPAALEGQVVNVRVPPVVMVRYEHRQPPRSSVSGARPAGDAAHVRGSGRARRDRAAHSRSLERRCAAVRAGDRLALDADGASPARCELVPASHHRRPAGDSDGASAARSITDPRDSLVDERSRLRAGQHSRAGAGPRHGRLGPVIDRVIETHGLRKYYGPTLAVADLSLSVGKGEIFGFLGPNGAGKTTSIKMLLALVQPSGGRGQVLGAPLGDRDARARIGFLPEHFRFHDTLSATELLRFHGRLYGLRGADLDARIDRLLTRVDLIDAADRPLHGYSKGMTQRAGLAAALLNDPQLVFLDEPTSGLDPLGRLLVRNIIDELRADGVTVFLNSHLLGEVEATCDRVAFVKRGRVVTDMHLRDGSTILDLELRVTPADEAVQSRPERIRHRRPPAGHRRHCDADRQRVTGPRHRPMARGPSGGGSCGAPAPPIAGRPVRNADGEDETGMMTRMAWMTRTDACPQWCQVQCPVPGWGAGVAMRNIITIAHLTLAEARRRKIVFAAALVALAFILFFSAALFFAHRDMVSDPHTSFPERQMTLAMLTVIGLFAANFLSVAFSLLLPIDTLSGEIDSGVMQTLAAKPLDRAEIVLGKWAGNLLIAFAYLLGNCAGLLLIVRVIVGLRARECRAGAAVDAARDHAAAQRVGRGQRATEHDHQRRRRAGVLRHRVRRRLCRAGRRGGRRAISAHHRDRGELDQPGRCSVATGALLHAARAGPRPRDAADDVLRAHLLDGVVGDGVHRADAGVRGEDVCAEKSVTAIL